MRCARISLKRIPLRQGPFIVPSSRQSKSKLHQSTSTVPMSGDAIGDGDVVVWHFSWSCCCYNVASWGFHPLLELRVLEFSEGAMFWTLVLEMFIVGQFVYCRHSILQWGCRLFLSALCVNIVCDAISLKEYTCWEHCSLFISSVCCLLLDMVMGMLCVQ